MNGQKWARWTLTAALLVSIGYNIANIILTHTDVHVALRVPQGVVWPAFLFLGIEVMVRNRDLRPRLAKVARFFLMLVTVPTAITSYINLHDFMVKAGEPAVAQISGPLAIDGLMLGCTLYLLAGRESAELLPAPIAEPIDLDEVLARHGVTEELPIPVSPAPAPQITELELAVASPRKTRTGWDVRAVIDLAADGVSAREIVEKVEGVSPATAGRFVKVAKMLRADPAAVIDSTKEKVNAEYIRIMREAIAR